MKYTVDEAIFKLDPTIKFGILIGSNIQNSATAKEDEKRLRDAEKKMQDTIQPDQLRELPTISRYREVLSKAQINPNKFPASVEAMFKRVIKGGHLPLINTLVDQCNAISIEQGISLGGHDLSDIHDDLAVRFSKKTDQFLPFGAKEYEHLDDGELIFTSGNIVQTRKWVWRQSELGKITLDSQRVFFQIAGFEGEGSVSLEAAMRDVEKLIIKRLKGDCEGYIVDQKRPSIEF